MSEPQTPSGRKLAGAETEHSPYQCCQEHRAAIEAEARDGYVPASLSPEWHAELDFVAMEARDAVLDALEAAVRALPGLRQAYEAWPGWVARAAVLDAIQQQRRQP